MQNFYSHRKGSANETISHFLSANAVNYSSNKAVFLIEYLCKKVNEKLKGISKNPSDKAFMFSKWRVYCL
jgi:hypothetical protein